MSETTADRPPRWKAVGPGLVVAATGVGAADLVATLVAGSRFGYTLLTVVALFPRCCCSTASRTTCRSSGATAGSPTPP